MCLSIVKHVAGIIVDNVMCSQERVQRVGGPEAFFCYPILKVTTDEELP